MADSAQWWTRKISFWHCIRCTWFLQPSKTSLSPTCTVMAGCCGDPMASWLLDEAHLSCLNARMLLGDGIAISCPTLIPDSGFEVVTRSRVSEIYLMNTTQSNHNTTQKKILNRELHYSNKSAWTYADKNAKSNPTASSIPFPSPIYHFIITLPALISDTRHIHITITQ